MSLTFDVVGQITSVEIVASGSGIRVLRYLRKAYSRGRWRKMKGNATVRLPNNVLRRVELHWYEAHGIGLKRRKDQALSRLAMKKPTKHFALCIDNDDYEASLIRGKVYRILRDPRAAKDDLIRIVDESGEDYLFHKSHFVFVDFPKSIQKKLLTLQGPS